MACSGGLEKLGRKEALFGLEGLRKVTEGGVAHSEGCLRDVRSPVQQAGCGVDPDCPEVLLQGLAGVPFDTSAEVGGRAAAGGRESLEVEIVFKVFFQVSEGTVCELIGPAVLLHAEWLFPVREEMNGEQFANLGAIPESPSGKRNGCCTKSVKQALLF